MSLRSTLGVIVLLSAAACSLAPAPTPSPTGPTNDDPELAARFPSTVGDEPFPVETYRDPDTMRLAGVTAAMLAALGVDVSAVSVATGHRPMPTSTSAHLSLFAYRVVGASEEALAEWFVPIMEAQSEDRPFQRSTISGKPVWTAIEPGPGAKGNVVYVMDDTAYMIYSDRPLMVAELIAALP